MLQINFHYFYINDQHMVFAISFLTYVLYLIICIYKRGWLPWCHRLKNPPAMQETWVRSLGGEETLEKGKATHSITLTWEILWTKEPGGLQPIGLQNVRHD